MKSFILYFYILLNLFSCLINPAFAEIILPADIVEGQDSAKSWIKNSHFEKNVNSVSSYLNTAGTSPVDGTGGGATITCTRTTSSPISGDGSLLITKDAANRQGQGCSIPFTIDRGDRATMQTIVLPYEVASGTFTAGTDTTNSDLVMWVYDVTNSSLIPVQGTGRFYSNTADYFYGYFQTNSNSTSYRLIFHQALTGTSAYTLKVDNVKIFKSKFSVGTTITDWVSWTPTGTWVTNTTYAGLKRRVGDTYEYQVSVSTTGAPTATSLYINLQETIDTAKVVSSLNKYLGEGIIHDNGTDEYKAVVVYQSATQVFIRSYGAGGTYVNFPAVNATQPMTWANTDSLNVRFSVPIVGLSSSTQQSDGYDGRQVVFDATSATSFSATTGGTWIKVTGITAAIDKVSALASNTYTVKTSGTYKIEASVSLNSSTTGLKLIAIYKNGAQVNNVIAPQSTSYGQINIFKTLELVAGDTIDLYYQNYAATETWNIQAYSITKIQAPTTISATEVVAALYTGTTTGSIGAAFNTTTYPTKQFDTHNAYSGGTYTCPVSGIYNISATNEIAGTESLNQVINLVVYKNGSAGVYLDKATVPGTSGTNVVSGSVLLNCNAGDALTIRIYTDITAPSYTTVDIIPQFSIHRIK